VRVIFFNVMLFHHRRAGIQVVDWNREKALNLRIKKTKIVQRINLSDEMVNEIQCFYGDFNREPFEMTRQNAWFRLGYYSKEMGIEIHPHMFRHGLALYLLSQNVPLPIISYRLGHKNTQTTAQHYLVVTPEIEKQFLQGVNFR